MQLNSFIYSYNNFIPFGLDIIGGVMGVVWGVANFTVGETLPVM